MSNKLDAIFDALNDFTEDFDAQMTSFDNENQNLQSINAELLEALEMTQQYVEAAYDVGLHARLSKDNKEMLETERHIRQTRQAIKEATEIKKGEAV